MAEGDNNIQMEWRVHLARSQPRRTAYTIGAILLCCGIVFVASSNILLAGICGLLLAAALGEFLFPIHYRIDEKGVHMRNLLSFRFLPWSDVRRCYRGPSGIKLSPLRNRSWREAFRGIHIWLPADEQERVVDLIRALRSSQGISIKDEPTDTTVENDSNTDTR